MPPNPVLRELIGLCRGADEGHECTELYCERERSMVATGPDGLPCCQTSGDVQIFMRDDRHFE